MSDSNMKGSSRTSLTSWLQMVLLVVVAALLVPVALSHRESMKQRDAVEEWGELHRAQATAAIEAGDYLRAERILEEAIKLAPSNPELRQEHLRAFVLRAAEQPQGIGESELDALAYALDVLEASKSDAASPATAVARGRLLLRRQDLEKARDTLEAAASAYPDYVHGHLALANLERVAGRSLEALAAFEKAAAAAPENLTALNNLGVQYIELGRLSDGLEMFEKAIAARDNAASRVNAGNALVRLKRVPEAIVHLTAAAGMKPQSAEIQRSLGIALHIAGNLDEAAGMLIRSLELRRDTETAHALGRVYLAQKRYDMAVEVYSRLTKADPESAEALFNLALSLHGTGNAAAAAQGYQVYLERAASAPAGEEERISAARKALEQLHGRTPATPATGGDAK